MKALAFFPLMLCCSVGLAAEEIPVRSPKMGEFRPDWWLSCWAEHIVVIEGTLEVEEDGKPDVTLSVDPKVAEQLFNKKVQGLQKSFSSFYLGTVKPKRLLFASPGIELVNLGMEATAKGDATPLKFLMPLWKGKEGGDDYIAVNGTDKMEGVFIFKYGSLLAGVPLVLAGDIPKDGLKSAEKVFEHRTRLDHLNHPYEEKKEGE